MYVEKLRRSNLLLICNKGVNNSTKTVEKPVQNVCGKLIT